MDATCAKEKNNKNCCLKRLNLCIKLRTFKKLKKKHSPGSSSPPPHLVTPVSGVNELSQAELKFVRGAMA